MYTVLDEIKEIFVDMGFEIMDGPEIELADYNFTKLNAPEGHPSRDWSDTFYLDEDIQIAAAHPDLSHADPGHGDHGAAHPHDLPRPGVPQGRGGRHPLPHVPSDRGSGGGQGRHHGGPEGHAERRHRGASTAPDTVTRFRPHHFPFTEPSCEVDIQCHKCGGKGCPTCKGEGWIEVLGAGMVHPKVLRRLRH